MTSIESETEMYESDDGTESMSSFLLECTPEDWNEYVYVGKTEIEKAKEFLQFRRVKIDEKSDIVKKANEIRTQEVLSDYVREFRKEGGTYFSFDGYKGTHCGEERDNCNGWDGLEGRCQCKMTDVVWSHNKVHFTDVKIEYCDAEAQ